MADEARLLDLASSVAEGSDVAWDEIERQASEAERSIIRQLRVLADISRTASGDAGAGASPDNPPAPARSDAPLMWAHLRLDEEIGRGSFGVVYRAWDTMLEREVALKLIEPRWGPRGLDVSRAAREARLLAKVHHSNVVVVHGADSKDDRFGIWMELVTGRTLEQILKMQGPMSPREAALVGVDLCHALAAIHRAGLLHRDIKPNNVMRAEGGRIVLMDFGSGRHIPAGDELPPDVAGTPLYLAPELFKREPPSIASDVYSLGVLLFHLVTGDYPVRGHDRRALLLAHEAGERQSLRDARPDLPPAFVEVIERAVAVNSADRYPSAGAFGGALAGLAGVPFKPEPLALSRRMRWSVAAGLGAAALVVLAAVVERNIRRDERSSPIPDTQSSVGLAGAGLSPAAARAGAYQINAALYAKRDGQDVPLTASSRVAPGDKLFLTVEASRPVFVYIINQDDKGAWFRLFPIPGLALTNPVPAGGRHRFPGLMEGEEFFWQVTSTGGREHFLVFAAPERLTAFEELFTRIPPAEVGRPVGEVPLSAQAVDALRGIGGLASGQPSSNASGALAFAELRPLATGVETADGLWARQITVQNPDP